MYGDNILQFKELGDTERVVTNAVLVCMWSWTIFCYMGDGGDEVVKNKFLSVCLCPANIFVFYFSAIRRDIDLKFIQDTNRVVLNSLKIINLHLW